MKMSNSIENSGEKIEKKYLKRKIVTRILNISLILASIFTLIFLLSVGELHIIPYDLIWLFFMYRLGVPFAVNLMGMIAYFNYEFYTILEVMNATVFDTRMPRILLAFAVGMGLSITGIVMQGLFKNPLADSYILGISSGAGLGATIAITFNLAMLFQVWTFTNMLTFYTLDVGFASYISNFMYSITISLCSFLFSCIITFLVYYLAKGRGEISVETLLLSGIALSFIFVSITQLFVLLSREQIHQTFLWGIGGFSGANWVDVIITGPVVIATSSILLLYGNDINVMVFGDDVAKSMGTDVHKSRKILIVLVSIETAICVAFVGPIAFVGLICPQIIRLLVGNDHRKLMPLAALFGGLFLVWMDFIAQTILDPGNYLNVYLNNLVKIHVDNLIQDYLNNIINIPVVGELLAKVLNNIIPQKIMGADLPVGIITSLIGGPFFIILLLIKRKRIFLGS